MNEHQNIRFKGRPLRWCAALLGLWLGAGCGELIDQNGVDNPCEDIASAISYRSFTCDGDGARANDLHEQFLGEFGCDASVQVTPGAHFDCVGQITGASCEQALALNNDFDGWLALGDSCLDNVGSGQQTGCGDAVSALTNTLQERWQVCKGTQDGQLVIAASARDGMGCTQDVSPEERQTLLSSCLAQLGQTCRNDASADSWIRDLPNCAQIFTRTSSTPNQICAEVSQSIQWGVRLGSVACGNVDANAVQTRFDQTYTCNGDLTVPDQLNAHVGCLRNLLSLSCAALPQDALEDPASWLDAAGCPLVSPR